MLPRIALALLSLSLTLPIFPAPAGARPGPDDTGQSVPDERPELDDYEDPDRFIADVLAWERQRRSGSSKDTQDQSSQAAKKADDWHDITGPEKLDEALRKAYGYTPPDYKARYRFNRTTHLSFPLPRLESNQMSGQAITGGLRDDQLNDRSLQPLPELRAVINETDQAEDVSISPRQARPDGESGPRQQSVRLRAR